MTDDDRPVVRAIVARNSVHPIAAEALRSDHKLRDDLGIDSMKFVLLVLEIEDRLGRRVFDLRNVRRVTTVADLELLVAGGAQ